MSLIVDTLTYLTSQCERGSSPFHPMWPEVGMWVLGERQIDIVGFPSRGCCDSSRSRP